MKVTYISNALIPSKTANSLHVMKACRSLANIGNDVTLLCPLYGDERSPAEDVYHFYNVEKNFEVKHLKVPNFKGKTFLYVVRIFLYVLFNRPNLIYSRFLMGSFIPSFLFRTVFESHAPVWREGRISRLIFQAQLKLNLLSRLVLITNSLRCVYEEHYPTSICRIIVAADGADLAPKTNQTEALYGIPERLKVGYVGHLYKGKGIEVIAEIAGKLPDCEFHIVGGHNNDVEHWRGIICENNVHFYGFRQQKELPRFISQFDICLLPNQQVVLASGARSDKLSIANYTSPLKMFEYMSYGKAIIASDLTVLKEVLNSSNSILVKCDDPSEWVDAIKELYSEETRDMLGKQALTDFERYYSWDKRMSCIMGELS